MKFRKDNRLKYKFVLLVILSLICSCQPNQEINNINSSYRDVQTIIDGFESRRMQTLKEIIETEAPTSIDEFPGIRDNFMSDQVKALAILYYADKTKDYSKVKYANQLIMDFCRLLDEPGDWLRKINHGSIMLALRILILYGKKPELLFPDTVDKLRGGKDPNGSINVGESLRSYFPMFFYDPQRHIGIHSWKIPWEGAWEYTENHRLQITVTALLLCQVFENECYDPPDGPPMPLRNKTPEIDDYWGYWKKAFYDYLIGYKKPRYPIEPWQFEEFRHMDWGITEKDGTTYTHVFLGDFWLLRDLIDDPVIAKYCEMLLDLTLIDYAEEAVHGVFVGAHENSEKHSLRLPGLIHLYNYLLFDDLSYKPVVYDYFGWGYWGYLSLLTSDYNPTNRDFPQIVIDMAVNKPNSGYMVTEAVGETTEGLPGKPKATWVMPDYSLGFGIDSWNGWGYHAGGAYVATPGKSLKEAGLAILPFGIDDNNHFDLKYSRVCPMHSVMGEGVAITQNGTNELPSKIWIKDGFTEDFVFDSPWMFFSATSVLNREIYIAVRPVLAEFTEDSPRIPGAIVGLEGDDVSDWAISEVPEDVSGKIIKFNNPADYLIWEMSDSEFHSSFETFKKDIADNQIAVSDSCINYTSCKGIQLSFNRSNDKKHMVNGENIQVDNYRHVVKNPWGKWPQNTKQAYFRNGAQSAYYNFDPKGEGIFVDQLPEKIIEN